MSQGYLAGQPDPPPSDHIYLDRRSLDYHRLIVSRIQDDPALLDVARKNIARWRELARSHKKEPYYLAEWEAELDKGLEHVLAFMVEDTDYAAQLRQSTPFVGIISQRERLVFLCDWNAKHMPRMKGGKDAPAMTVESFLSWLEHRTNGAVSTLEDLDGGGVIKFLEQYEKQRKS